MIRVLHVLGGLDRGGAETFVMNLYRSIDRSQIQFDFITHTEGKQAYFEEIESLGGKVYWFKRFNGKNIVEIKRQWDYFFAEHPEYKILHSHVRSYASVFIPIAKKHGLVTIVHSHSTSNGSGIAAIVKDILQFPLRYQADYLFSCSKEAGEWLFGKKATKRDNYKIINNGIILSRYRFDNTVRKSYRDSLGINDSTIVFCHVGRFHEAKNHRFLIRIYKDYLKAAHQNTKLIMVGDGPLKAEIEKEIDEFGIKEHVELLGSRSDVSQLLMASDCFLFPSQWEGLPVSVIEAQAAGLTCLISDTITKDVAISELVKYLPIGKGTSIWVKKMNQLDYKRMNVSELIVEHGFDISTEAEKMGAFYKRIIE